MSLNHGQSISTFMLECYLPLVDGLNTDAACKLLYPDDPQDIPCAIELLLAIITIAKINPMLPPVTSLGSTPDVNIVTNFEALRVWGLTLENLLKPFTNVKLSLSVQLVHLSCFLHLLYAFYRDQHCCFIPNQLYYDAQMMVKNTFFSVARQQKLDPSFPFSLLDLGDDPLELTFAFMRMLGGHNSAFNYHQVIDWLCAVHDISDIYSHNPDIHHGHRCLNMHQKESVNHITCAAWVGNTISGNCDLLSCWLQGRQKALEVLQTSKIPTTSYDFNSLFVSGSSIDMLCIFRDGKYPSVDDTEEHKDLVDILCPSMAERAIQDVPVETVQGETEVRGLGDEDGELDIDFDEALEDELNALNQNPSPTSPDSIVDMSSPTAPLSGPGVCTDDYLWCNEQKWVHKQSVCHLIITRDFSPKSTTRLLCVRGYTFANKRVDDLETGHIIRGNQFIVGDVFVTLVQTRGKELGLTFVHSTYISQGGSARGHIKTATLMSPQAGIKVTGDIMVLQPSVTSPIPNNDSLWLWTRSFIKAMSMVPGAEVKTTQVVSITLGGHLLTIVNPSTATASTHLTPEDQAEVNVNDMTWALTTEAIDTAITLLWG